MARMNILHHARNALEREGDVGVRGHPIDQVPNSHWRAAMAIERSQGSSLRATASMAWFRAVSKAGRGLVM